MTTRLDRLFVLLENGGSGVTRGAAAQQLGEVVRLHPQDLTPLLGRVHTLLSSKSWDVRIAAGLAVEAIITNVPQWAPTPTPSPASGLSGDEWARAAPPRLALRAFNIGRVLERGSYLMAADEKLFHAQDENTLVEPAERLAQQQRLVNQRLGLDLAEAVGVDVRGIVSTDDLTQEQEEATHITNGERKDTVLSIVKREMKCARLALSSRELNRARRKAKMMARQKSVDVSECVGEDEPEKKRLCVEEQQPTSDEEDRMVVDEGSSSLLEEGCEWPLEAFCDGLASDLFCESWENRHGAATALRHIIRVQGRGGGKATYHTKQQMEESHQAWLEDLAVRLVCVLALDRFGDFVSDQVVAPVRETCAQALGSVLHLMCEEGVYGVLSLLESMLSWHGWETRHGGLLGLKYLLAVREDMHTQLLPRAYPHIYRGLLDEMDDVVAVAASCLVPVAESVASQLEAGVVSQLVATLWDALLDIDDLTSSTSSVLLLLAKLLAHPANRDSMSSELSQLVPRLWPFLYHSSSSVRGSTLRTLHTLTASARATTTTTAQPQSVPTITQSATTPVITQVQSATTPVITQVQSVTAPVITQTQSVITQAQSATTPVITQPQSATTPVITQAQSATAPVITQKQSATTPVITQPQSITTPVITQPQSATIPVITHSQSDATTPASEGDSTVGEKNGETQEKSDCGEKNESKPPQKMNEVEGQSEKVMCDDVENALIKEEKEDKMECEEGVAVKNNGTRDIKEESDGEMRTVGEEDEPELIIKEENGEVSTNITPEKETKVNDVKQEPEEEEAKVTDTKEEIGDDRESPQNVTTTTVENGTPLSAVGKNSSPGGDPAKDGTVGKPSVPGSEGQRGVDTSAIECAWLQPIIQQMLTHIYQRALLEESNENLSLVFKIWTQVLAGVSLEHVLPVVCPLVSPWLCLSMANPKVPMDPSLLLMAPHSKSSECRRVRQGSEVGSEKVEAKYYLGGYEQHSDLAEKQQVVVRARCAAARLLGSLSQVVTQPMPGLHYPPDEGPMECYVRLLMAHLSSRSAVQRQGAAAVIRRWAATKPSHPCPPLLLAALHTCLTEVVYYDEIALSFTRLQQETRDFMAMLRHYKLPLDPALCAAPVLTLEQIQSLSGPVTLTLFSACRLRPKVLATLEERRRAIQNSVSQTSSDQLTLATTTQAVIAGAVVRFDALPTKLNPVIKPLMDSIKKEKNEQLQGMSAEDLTCLLEMCADRTNGPNGKVIKNLAAFLCVDQEHTPRASMQSEASQDDDHHHHILSLSSQLKSAEQQLIRRSSSLSRRGPGRPPANAKKEDPTEVTEAIREIEQQAAEVQRRGCTQALQNIARYFGTALPEKVPQLWQVVCGPLQPDTQGNIATNNPQEDVNWLQVVEVVVPALHLTLVQQFGSMAGVLESRLYHEHPAVRHMAARVLGALAAALPVVTLTQLVETVVPQLSAIHSDSKRRGAVEAIHCIIQKMGFDVVPYSVLLIVPLLGSMSDPDMSVRLTATHCFATLIRLLPLEGGIPDPPSLSHRMLEQKRKEREFLERLLDPTKIANHTVPVPIHAELRSYQQSGVNWLFFLNQYKLHGILCDDMGLGKTLQSICILATDHHTKEAQQKQQGSSSWCAPIQSLVVCPPSLTGHWVYEVEKFVDRKYLNPLHYTGPPAERYRLKKLSSEHNLVVASYDIVRNDIDFFSTIKWNYVILDEGHVIKNSKTKSCRAIKQLVAQHRLILSGTPIQNNVLELWSLFDFLMPGFLGSERQFVARYSRPILQARDPKSSGKDQEAGVLAMEALHRQTLPFLLRRVKEDVLSDLPPKITQDYYCELSPLQEQLYEDFARTQANQNISDSLRTPEVKDDASNPRPHTHIFQALQYLRKVCNHPKLVVKPRHPEFERITAKLSIYNSSLSDISHSAKLPALKQLLLDCGIGCGGSEGSTGGGDAVVSQHRALIFCQLQAMLDIIEHDLLRVHLPGVTYLRLDGSVPAGCRHSLVQRFNNDPSIDLLLLTTQVGGLGLNLIGADTVIFVEHDWNPMRDLQAMDRAHRIGQKRVVNVYRLVTRGTLEEKIMGLQKFKMMTANTVISQENSSLMSMGTNQLLDLFTLDPGKSSNNSSGGQDLVGGCQSSRGSSSHTLGLGAAGAKAVLESLPELWDQDQYENEYDLESFMLALKKSASETSSN